MQSRYIIIPFLFISSLSFWREDIWDENLYDYTSTGGDGLVCVALSVYMCVYVNLFNLENYSISLYLQLLSSLNEDIM